MAEFIKCPACSAQLAYMPDMVGLRVDCPGCRHPFVVAAPARRTRATIAIPLPPAPLSARAANFRSARVDEGAREARVDAGTVDELTGDNLDLFAALELNGSQQSPVDGFADAGADAGAGAGARALRAVTPSDAARVDEPISSPSIPFAPDIADERPMGKYSLNIDLSLPGDGERTAVETLMIPSARSSNSSFAEAGSDESAQEDIVPVPARAQFGEVDEIDDEPPLPQGVVAVPSMKPPGYLMRDLELTSTRIPAPAAASAKPRVQFKRPPREWTTADRTFFNLAIVLVVAGVLALLLPSTGMEMSRLKAVSDVLPLAATLLVVVGVVTCAVVAFRQFAKWVFLATSGVFGLLIIGLFIYAAIKSPGSYDAPALAQADAVKFAAAAPPAVSAPQQPGAVANAKDKSADAAATSAPAVDFGYQTLCERFGPQRVVRVSIPAPEKTQPDAALASKAHENLSMMASTWYVRRQSDHLECLLAPVDDFSEFVGKVASVGKTSDVDSIQRKLTVHLP